MDLNEEKPVEGSNAKDIIAAVVLFVMYVAVSTMDYNDCLRGAVSC